MITRTSPSCQTENRDLAPVEQTSWQQLLSGSTISAAQLLKMLEIDASELAASQYGEVDFGSLDFPVRAPAPFIQRMKKGDIHDPLLQQVLPLLKEHDVSPGYSHDPLEEALSNVAPGLIHKYHGRALCIVSKACAIHCRYCFRRHFPYEDNLPGREQWSKALSYLEAQTDIREIIYSGGDPLASSDKHLAWLTERMADIPHIQRLRIHTRLPVVLPQRVDNHLLEWLNRWSGQKVIVIHSNHAQELDQSVKHAIDQLKSTGATVLNQTVLLKGINDSVEALVNLSEKLFDIGVLPYYLHLLDPVAGAGHFAIADARAKRLMGAVSAKLPGYLVPRLVREQAQRESKTLILPTL